MKARFLADLKKFRYIGLDTAILIYHLEDIAPYGKLTEEAFGLMVSGSFTGLLSAISVTELMVKPFTAGDPARVTVCEIFIQSMPHLVVVPIDIGIAKEGARLRSQYALRTPDALILASAMSEGAQAFLTNDTRLRRVEREGITIIVLDDYT